MLIKERLAKIRSLMLAHQIDFYYVPTSDAHQNEYVPECWQRRTWISGFTGSAGEALIGLDTAFLWTDGRYTLQAQQELDLTEFQLMSQTQGMAIPIDQWFAEQSKRLRVGVDPTVISISLAEKMQAALAKNNGQLVAITDNWIDRLWSERPALQHRPVMRLPIEYSGQATTEKLAQLRALLKAQQVTAHALNALDAIAWLFNIRGQDIAYNPVVISYALVTETQALLCVNTETVSMRDRQALLQEGITLLPYEQFATALQQQPGRIWLDPSTASWWMGQLLPANRVLLAPSPITLWKACKNSVEIQGSKTAHQRDAVALIKFMHWLENHGQQGFTEIELAEQLEVFRQQGKHYYGCSFATIAGFAEHGAVVHYRAEPNTTYRVDDSNLFLLDSGGQYLEGTTDITRMLHLGTPTAKQKRDYTLVLKGHLALRHIVFPEGVVGAHIDALARQFLWQYGLNYTHGTGHGVGAFLCVHEGPQRISPGLINAPLKPGMIVSNEPGVYLTGQYGIRIENLCVIQEVIPREQSESGHGPFYGFEDLTLVPYNRKLIDIEFLSDMEIRWLNEYHQQILIQLAPHLPTEVATWLQIAAAPLSRQQES